MKKLIVGMIACLCCFSVFAGNNFSAYSEIKTLSAEENEKELRNSIKNFAVTANEIGSGSGFLGVTFDPFGAQNLMLTANFSLIGVWGAEISGGWSLKRNAFAIEIDALNFSWQFPMGETMAWAIGVGCPFIGTLGSYHDIFGIKPCADLRIHFFANHDYGLSFFIRPGYIVDFSNGSENNAFSCPIGIMWRLPSSFIAEAFASVL